MCDHDVEHEHDPRAPFGFESVRCKKCGTKFYIPKGEEAEQYDCHVIRFRSYQRAYMAREYRHAGERWEF